jgi:cyclopropane fatty-acyl-phospholipid synthase-like methyltransferase
MITCDSITKSQIRLHYDLANVFYWLLWGPHIHHGLWDGDESADRAQIRLIERLATEAGIRPGSRVLDVGSGMGGSAIYLAKQLGCDATGLTVSPIQRSWAGTTARLRGLGPHVRFICNDAETAEFPASSFDIVWSIECTEHLFDKPRFFRRAAGWLRPGGRTAICAWLAGDEPQTHQQRQQVYEICEGFLCPSLGTEAEYTAWMQQAGLRVQSFADFTPKTMRTWEICRERVRRSGVRFLARLAGMDMVRFLDRFDTFSRAYRTGAMRYGCFVAQLPA